MLDLYVLSLHRQADQNLPDLPGVLVVPSAKPGEHGREGDLLLLHLSLSPASGGPSDAFTVDEIQQMLKQAAGVYTKGRGSITIGLRAAAETLNGVLLERNRSGRPGELVQAALSLVAFRDDTLFIVHAGPPHAIVVNPEGVQDLNEPFSERGLGFSTSLPLKYFQAKVSAGDVLVLSPTRPDAWTSEALTGSHQLTFEHLRRRLLNQVGPSLQAVVVKFQPGAGQVRLLRHRTTTQPTLPAVPADEAVHPAPTAAPQPAPAGETTAPLAPVAEKETTVPAEEPTAKTTPPSAPESEAARNAASVSRPSLEAALAMTAPTSSGGESETGEPLVPIAPVVLRAPAEAADSPALGMTAAEAEAAAPDATQPLTRAERHRRLRDAHPLVQRAAENSAALRPVEEIPASTAPPAKSPRRGSSRRRQAASGWLGIKAFFARIGAVFAPIKKRISPPKPAQPAVPLSPYPLLFIAIVIPLIVVGVATTVYLQAGRGEQRAAFLTKAIAFDKDASTQKDPALKRNNWTQALAMLDRAEAFSVTDDSHALRLKIQQGMDANEGVLRIEFKPLNRFNFASGVNFTHIVSTSSDLYLVDSGQGRVVRMFMTGAGYEMDSQFKCGPGIYGSLQIGALVDVVVLPPNPRKATVMAIDAAGSLLYCIPGAAPQAVILPAPDQGFGKVAGMAYYQDSLVVLDVQANGLWRYFSIETRFENKPSLFFIKVIPSLLNVIGVTYYGDDVFLLRQDGQVTWCSTSTTGTVPSRCQDPANFADSRPGHDASPTQYPEAAFSQIISTTPPDPSIYMLDIKGPSIYHFTLQLKFTRLLRPADTGEVRLPRSQPTSFAITPTRLAILAYGNQLFSAQLP